MFRKKDLERRTVAAVAQARGAIAQDELGEWPDGWIMDDGGRRIPLEVVSAFPEADASAWARAYSRTATEAQRLQEQLGAPVSWSVHNGRGIVLDGHTQLPVRTRPVDPVAGVFPAIGAKANKYGPGEAKMAILVVHHVQWPFPLDDRDLARVGHHATQIRAPFREIWVVNEYGDPAQRVPYEGPATRQAAEGEASGA